MKVRIRFEKDGSIRYIGHLDIMRFFHKALQRAKMDVSFSTGFHPHPIMSFASPLGVGLTSVGEYMDVEMGSVYNGQQMIADLNAQMVDGIRVTGIRVLPDEGRKNNAMATVGLADYRVSVPGMEEPEEGWANVVSRFLAQDEILITKKTKKNEMDVNIRELILAFAWNPEAAAFDMRLTASSMNNLKPELAMDSLFRFVGSELHGDRLSLQICRQDMMTQDGTSLGALGDEIL